MKLVGRIPHPIPYQGSKRNLAPQILAHMPSRFDRLVEPFAGSAAISLAVAARSMAGSFWLNDAHLPIIQLWRMILDSPDELSCQYRHLWGEQLGHEKDYFNEIRAQFNQTHQPEHFLYLLARCVKAAIRYNGNGEFNNTPDNRRKGAKPSEMDARIKGASHLLASRTFVTSTDYLNVIAACTENDVIYMDPPYQGVCGGRDNRYAPKVDHEEFKSALADLNKRNCMFLVSYDGRTGDKVYGDPLPKSLKLTHLEVCAGRSTQATLLGKSHVTYESLYLSQALVKAAQNGRRLIARTATLFPAEGSCQGSYPRTLSID